MHMLRVRRGSVGLARSFATKPPIDAKRAGGVVLFGGLVIGTAYLGAWQIHRYNWKVDKIAVRRAELALPPVPLAQVLSATSSEAKDSSGNSLIKAAAAVRGQARDYQEAAEGACRAVVVGTWDHDASMLIGRRGAPDGLIGEKPQGIYDVFSCVSKFVEALIFRSILGEGLLRFPMLRMHLFFQARSSPRSLTRQRVILPLRCFALPLLRRNGIVAVGLLPGDRAALAQRTKVAGEPGMDASGRSASRRFGQA
jgi:hypothetical protein